MDDAPLLKVEHDVRQLVGILQNLVRSQAILQGDDGQLAHIAANELAVSYNMIVCTNTNPCYAHVCTSTGICTCTSHIK